MRRTSTSAKSKCGLGAAPAAAAVPVVGSSARSTNAHAAATIVEPAAAVKRLLVAKCHGAEAVVVTTCVLEVI